MRFNAFIIVAAIGAMIWGQGVFATPPQQISTTLIEIRDLSGASGSASQGLALGGGFYYGANATSISRFDTNWNFIENVPIAIAGVDHLGAIDYHEGFIWGGFLNSSGATAKVAKIRASDLSVVQTWDLTPFGLTWIDPVAFDGQYLWVGQAATTFHRFRLEQNGDLVPAGILRYAEELHFSQGLRIFGDHLYSIHTFGSMAGLFEFIIPEDFTETSDMTVAPVRVWNIQETVTHLEGFDFLPGDPVRLWHAQGQQVDLYELDGLAGIIVPEPGTLAILFGAAIFLTRRRAHVQLRQKDEAYVT